MFPTLSTGLGWDGEMAADVFELWFWAAVGIQRQVSQFIPLTQTSRLRFIHLCWSKSAFKQCALPISSGQIWNCSSFHPQGVKIGWGFWVLCASLELCGLFSLNWCVLDFFIECLCLCWWMMIKGTHLVGYSLLTTIIAQPECSMRLENKQRIKSIWTVFFNVYKLFFVVFSTFTACSHSRHCLESPNFMRVNFSFL